MYKMHLPVAVKLPAMYLKIMEKLDKGTGILQTVSVADYNELA